MITNTIPSYSIRQYIDVKIPMRDGVALSADIFLPKAAGPFPVILTRTPYGNNDPRRLAFKKWMVERGFGFVFQDCRGRYDSDGVWEPFRTEREDGWDTIQWIQSQSFSNGNIGMTGGSYEGYTTWIEAYDHHPALKAIAPLVPLPDPIINVPYQNGVFFWNMIVWGLFVYGKTNQNISFVDWPSLFNYRPLRNMAKEVGMNNNRFWKNWMDHPMKDKWWDEVCYMNKWDKVDIPVFHICGWYDDDGISTYKNFPGMRMNAKTKIAQEQQRLLIGPWPHKLNQSTTCGEIDFGSGSMIDLNKELFYFFSSHLANEDHVQKDNWLLQNHTKCKLFLMGENQWHFVKDWPIPEAITTSYYLHSKGAANTIFGNGTLLPEQSTEENSFDSFEYDPSNPVPYVTDPIKLQLGEACDQNAIERRPDVLVYTSPVLQEDLIVCGRVFLQLYVSSSVPATDFTGKLVDVYPSGKAIQICDGIQRAEFRNSLRKPEWLERDRVYKIEVDMWATGIRFLKGHQIRLEVSSSAYPKFYPHSNTKESQADATVTKKAVHKIYHDTSKPSCLIVDVIPENILKG